MTAYCDTVTPQFPKESVTNKLVPEVVRVRKFKAILLGSVLVGLLLPVVHRGQETNAAPSLSKAQWREDLKYLADELPNGTRTCSRRIARAEKQFERSVAELDAGIPNLQGHQIIVKMIQIAGSVGDGHTVVHVPPYFRFLPDDVDTGSARSCGVTGATKEYESALGTRNRKRSATSP
jgi:hypothetical protein